MYGSWASTCLAAAALVLTTGCAAPRWFAADTSQPARADTAAAVATSPAEQAYAEHPDPEALRQVMAEVHQLQALDPAAEAELLKSLAETPPDLWPLVLQQFRAAVAYRRQAEKGSAVADAGQSASTAELPPEPPSAAPPLPTSANPGLAEVEQVSTQAAVEPPIEPARAEEAQSVVVAASHTESVASPDDWQSHVGHAARALESKLGPNSTSGGEVPEHACLRMLYLINGQREDALRPIPGAEPSAQDFWSKEFYGLATLLDKETTSGPTRRVAEAQRHLSEAASRLGDISPLTVRNLTFVTSMQGYGTFEPFDPCEFSPGQRVLLYAEVENFKSTETADGFGSALKSSYRIMDAAGRLVAEHDFDVNEECCRNQRRDFFIGYDFSMPKRIYVGRHVLQLTVEDVNSGKIGQSSAEFTVCTPDK